ncbi:hypothetical protein E4Z66_17925 [Aliishimia ponticola]|uniref:Orotidine 5-phosphate decarboxylase n=1 Tax=Aliishimia ponticola TaxID=2499833 RepID=A0A4S4N904_9RHOB|nr:hypothetical protein [Aliishimia ponticola]THH34837.1 hypothetical protein E4Z66_17925 [Aliishimia ponticola]
MTEQYKTECSNVIYNAAEQAFEARVTVHDDTPVTYACAIDAPITMDFEDAADGLVTQALRRHGADRGLCSSRASDPQTLPEQTPDADNVRPLLRRGLPLGQYGFFRGRAA